MPDFFVFGSPKCGSSALCTYLTEHPRVCFSDPKEVNYFNTDFPSRKDMSLAEYRQYYFPELEATTTAVGEGSVRYMFSQVAAEKIRRYNPEAKIIIMVRQPVEMFHSLYYQNYAGYGETAATPEEAWRQQRQWADTPTAAAQLCQYADICKLGEHLSRVYEHFSREQVLVLFHEDFVRDPQGQWQLVQRFLGVPDDARERFPVVNRSRATRYEWIRRGLKRFSALKKRLGITAGVGNTRVVQQVLFGKKRPLAPEFRQELIEYFRGDIELLARLTKRDLSHWLR